MKTTVEDLDDNKVKLSIEVDAHEFEVEVEKAFRKIAREVRLPGFRKGKVPRRVLEARFGSGMARGQALEDSIPEYFLAALNDHEIDIISPPEYEVTAGADDGDVAFDAVVEVRPQVEIAGYHGMTVEVQPIEPTAAEVDERVDAFRRQFAELETVERPAIDDDTVMVDIATTYEGEGVEGLTADDYSYRVGSDALVPELDENLRGSKAGDILEFEADHPSPDESGRLHFRILVKQVQQQVLPDMTDELVADASDFATVEEFRDDVASRLREARLEAAHDAWHDESASQLAELIDEDPPVALIDTEVRHRVEDMAQRLAGSGIGFQQYLDMVGQTVESLIEQMREPATKSVKVDMALRALAVAEGLEATDDDVETEFEKLAEGTGSSVEELRERISTPNQLMLFRADISKRKAADWLLENVNVVDTDGNPIDKQALHPESHDQDHDHDHGPVAQDPADEEE